MKIRTFRTLEDDVYKVTIYTEDWSQGDIQLMERFGEPEINLGGTFGDSSPTQFELPDLLAKIKTESPFNASFDKRDYADALDRANVWADAIALELAEAVATLRQQIDGFTRESVEEV